MKNRKILNRKQFPKLQIIAILIVSTLLASCSQPSSRSANMPSSPSYTTTTNTSSMGDGSGLGRGNGTGTFGKSAPNGGFAPEEEKSKGERYAEIDENPFLESSRAPLSTFSIDVDTASYSNVRRFINDGQTPPRDAVRIEELINYFEYDYPQPVGDVPFSVTNEIAACPWNSKHKIVSIGLQGKKISLDNVPPSNLVFLLDVSGSMNAPDKLPLLKASLKTLINQLSAKDRIAIVTYAGNSGLALPSTTADRKADIINALDNLNAGGSTNGGQGIQLAYKVAQDNFIADGNNRVILATDGDFNLGLTSDNELVSLIENKRKSNVFLSVIGFGTGNTNDSMMEKLADKGNGNYAYIDTIDEARKALGSQVAGTLYTIAKDVKIQVEFNPAKVNGYRLIGYENRILAAKDFNDDKKDAGEIGAGISVTALYEIVPKGETIDNKGVDDLKYSQPKSMGDANSRELLTVKLRYKEPKESESKLLSIGLTDTNKSFESASDNLRFASSVAEFGLLLRDSRYKGTASFNQVAQIANSSKGSDLKGYRADFVELVGKAK
ncbi:MAG: VWA domain-containing protein [Pyrinomonadaceae bacterium]|nr:VWA domain-containing protein [Pyrinomonadaceae bacterium]